MKKGGKKRGFYVDLATGDYLGEFDGDAPEGAKEVDRPPRHAAEKWTGADWDGSKPPPEPENPLEAAIREIAKGYGVARRKAILRALGDDV